MSASATSIALVTGASRGIGKAIALALQAAGHDVFGTATSAAGAENISAFLGSGRGLQLDITDRDSCDQCLAAVNKVGALHALVNNAGITRDNIALRMKDGEWDEVIGANLSGTYNMCRRVARGMIKQRSGRIITIGSIIGSIGNIGQMNYAAAKAGVVGMSKSLAIELGARGVTVNVIAPGFVVTDMTESLSDDVKQQMLARIPLGRFAQPEEVADLAVFLASAQAGYITGQTLHVNGGLYFS